MWEATVWVKMRLHLNLVACYSLVARPSPSFLSLAVWLSGKGPGTFSHVSDITGRKTG